MNEYQNTSFPLAKQRVAREFLWFELKVCEAFKFEIEANLTNNQRLVALIRDSNAPSAVSLQNTTIPLFPICQKKFS